VLVLHEGRIVEDAPVAQFFSNPQHAYSRDVLRIQREKGDMFRPQPPKIGAGAAVVETAGLTVHFPIRNSRKVVQAVSGISLAIGKGEAVGLVGESGSGKTTAGRAMVRLVDPTDGKILFQGDDISRLDTGELRRFRARMQIVFQDPFDSLNPRWTIAEILQEPLNLHTKLSAREKRARAGSMLELVGLDPDILDRKPRGLGGRNASAGQHRPCADL
jgi:ABC-type glutathione transport system ATPase component